MSSLRKFIISGKKSWEKWSISWDGQKENFQAVERLVERSFSRLSPSHRACYDAVCGNTNSSDERLNIYRTQSFDQYFSAEESVYANVQVKDEKTAEAFDVADTFEDELARTNSIEAYARKTEAEQVLAKSQYEAKRNYRDALKGMNMYNLLEQKQSDTTQAKIVFHEVCQALNWIIQQFQLPSIMVVLDSWQNVQTPPVPDGDGVSLWKELQRRYTTKTVSSKVNLYAKYNSGVVSMSSCNGSLHQYINEFNYLKRLVENSGTVLSEDIHSHLFLKGIQGPNNDGGPYQSLCLKMQTEGLEVWPVQRMQQRLLRHATETGIDIETDDMRANAANKRNRDSKGSNGRDGGPKRSKIHPVYKVDVSRAPKGVCVNCLKKHGGPWWKCRSGHCGHCGKPGHLRAYCRCNPLRFLHPMCQQNSHLVPKGIRAGAGGEDRSYYDARVQKQKERGRKPANAGNQQVQPKCQELIDAVAQAVTQSLLKKSKRRRARTREAKYQASQARGSSSDSTSEAEDSAASTLDEDIANLWALSARGAIVDQLDEPEPPAPSNKVLDASELFEMLPPESLFAPQQDSGFPLIQCDQAAGEVNQKREISFCEPADDDFHQERKVSFCEPADDDFHRKREVSFCETAADDVGQEREISFCDEHKEYGPREVPDEKQAEAFVVTEDQCALKAFNHDLQYLTADTGANWSYTNAKELYDTDLKPRNSHVHGISNNPLRIHGEGRVGCIKRFQFVPEMTQTLLSMWDLLQSRPGQQILLTPTGIHIRDAPKQLEDSWGDPIGHTDKKFWRVDTKWLKHQTATTVRPVLWPPKQQRLKLYDVQRRRQAFLADIRDPNPAVLIHDRMMHRQVEALRRAQSKGIIDLGIATECLHGARVGACAGCGLGQACLKPRPKGKDKRRRNFADELFGCIGMDIKTPNLPTGYDGTKHYLHIVDVKSRSIWPYGMKTKTGAEIRKNLEHFVEHVVKRYRPKAIDDGVMFFCIRTDNANELLYGEAEKYLAHVGYMDRESSCVNTSYQNGIAERSIRTLDYMTRATMLHRGIPQHLHPLVKSHAARLHLRLPCAALKQPDGGCLTPYHVLTRQPKLCLDLSWLRTLGAPCFVVQDEDQRKRSQTFKEIAFLRRYIGFNPGQKGHLVMQYDWKLHAKPRIEGPYAPRRVYFVEDIKEELRLKLQRRLADPKKAKKRSGQAPVAASNDDGDVIILLLEDGKPTVVSQGRNAVEMITAPSSRVRGVQRPRSPAATPTPTVSPQPAVATPPTPPQDSPTPEPQLNTRFQRMLQMDVRATQVVPRFSRTRTHTELRDQRRAEEAIVQDPDPPDPPDPLAEAWALLGRMTSEDGYAWRMDDAPPHRWLRISTVPTPKDMKAAMLSPQRDLWYNGLKYEYQQLFKKGGLRFEKPGKNAVWVHCVPVLKVKDEVGDGYATRYRVRLTANGSRQVRGIHYTENWAPTVHMRTLRILMAVAAVDSLHWVRWDCTSAYLNGRLDKNLNLFLRNPPLLNVPEGMATRIYAALYGLKQSGNIWYKALSAVLKSDCKLVRSDWDACLFFKRVDSPCFIMIHVDDGKMLSNHKKFLKQVIQQIKAHFEITILQDVQKYLGLKIVRQGNRIVIFNDEYIASALQAFRIPAEATCPPMPHVPSQNKLFAKDAQVPPDTPVPYPQLIGTILYIAVKWRPDIAFMTTRLSQFMSCPSKLTWKAAKHVLKYLKGTPTLGLVYEKAEPPAVLQTTHRYAVEVYTDTDHAGERPHFRSTHSYLVYVNRCLVDWGSRLIKVSIPSAPATEAYGAYEGATEALLTHNLLTELGLDVHPEVVVWCDCASVLRAVENLNSKMKRHIGTRLACLQQWVAEHKIQFRKIPGTDNPADIGTKGSIALPLWKHLTPFLVGDCRLTHDDGG